MQAAAAEKKLVEMQAQAADEKASMGQAAEEQLQAMQQRQLTVAEALTEQLSTEHAARTNAEEIAQANAIENVQELMRHQIDEASTLSQQLRQECTAREEAEQAAQV